MDTKLKNNKKMRRIITISVLLLVTVVNVLCFPYIGREAAEQYSEEVVNQRRVNMEALQALYEGALVMYYEQTMQTSEIAVEPMDVFVKQEALNEEQEAVLQENFGFIYSQMERNFENYRYQVDYYVTNGKMSESNTAQDLKMLLSDKNTADSDVINELILYYRNLWVIEFDELGQMQVTVLTSEDISPDMLVKGLKQAESDYGIADRIQSYAEFDNAAAAVNKVLDFTVVYGIPEDSSHYTMLYTDAYHYSDWYSNIEDNAAPAFFFSVLALAGLAFAMTNPKIWNDITLKRKGRRYVFEPAVLGVCMLPLWYGTYCDAIYQIEARGLKGLPAYIGQLAVTNAFRYSDILGRTLLVMVIMYAIFAAFCPALSLGVKGYIKEYCFIYQIIPQMKKYWKKFRDEVEHINFEETGTKTIVKIVVVNFVILTVLTCFWFLGILGLIIYSLVLFYFLAEYYDKIRKNYQVLKEATNRIAEGDLSTTITEDIGVFEPMKEDLTQIQMGFKKAVDEEIKSQRMKTELITNVSHDLKTPLTAITTYVELLKKEDITDEERREYVKTLERKALRLKVLIEDLFEVSKASSNNITLNLMQVDIVKLMKQVAVEHREKYDEAGLQLRWTVPQEKTELLLDNQKTYRIFENLFLNIQKYAMPNSRVYIDVADEAGEVHIVMKNMSAEPLNVAGEELTERFVRGDASRNTEGSGLGLAIAKNFTEAQKGKFEVQVDGDLFKTILVWRKE